jgi:pimeloyl-ACP methyl ester carboxylesterase
VKKIEIWRYNRANKNTFAQGQPMNSLVTDLLEKMVELGYFARTFWAPNPFRPLDQAAERLLAAPLEDFYTAPVTPSDLVFTPLAEAKGEKLGRFRFTSSTMSSHAQNNTVHGLADLRPKGTARAALIFLHGHMMTRATLFPLLWYSRQVVREDFDVYYMNLPYHMLRRPRGSYSGQYSLNADILGSALAFMQGVQDVRALLSWIEQDQKVPVVLAGISLGAFTACMTSIVDARPRAVLSALGGGSLASIPWDGYQGGKIRRQMQSGGVTFDQLERSWRLLSPGCWKPRLDPARVLMIGGKHDRIVTPENVRKLWLAWDQPEIRWYACGHVSSALYHREISQVMSTFLMRSLA